MKPFDLEHATEKEAAEWIRQLKREFAYSQKLEKLKFDLDTKKLMMERDPEQTESEAYRQLCQELCRVTGQLRDSYERQCPSILTDHGVFGSIAEKHLL